MFSDSVSKSASQMAANAIIRAIVAGDLKPGHRLHQGDLAARLGISTTPVREALTDLAGQGFVRIDTHRGAYVTELGVEELRDVYAFRAVAESEAIKLTALRISQEELGKAVRLVERMERLDDPTDYVLLNHQFHALLANASRSPQIASVLAKLRNVTLIYVARAVMSTPQILVESNSRHRMLIEACEARNTSLAAEVALKDMLCTLELAVSSAVDLAQV